MYAVGYMKLYNKCIKHGKIMYVCLMLLTTISHLNM